MGRVEGKVAFITGAARSIGRAQAIRLAEEGASVVVTDIVRQIDTAGYKMGVSEELAETAALVEKAGGKVLARSVDVRNSEDLKAAVQATIERFGRLDIVSANAGILSYGLSWEMSDQQWQDMIDVNLTGVWKTAKAAIPAMIAAGNGGSMILTSSIAGFAGIGGTSHYNSAKHGVLGLMRTLVNEVSAHNIRVNSVAPTVVDTPMIQYQAFYEFFGANSREEFGQIFQGMHALQVPWIQPVDVANAVLFLASEESRYVTGLAMPVDAGFLTKI